MNDLRKYAINEDPEIMALIESCASSTGEFCLEFLSENFYSPFSSIHNDMLDLIDIVKPKKQVAMCATRGIGKTTIARAIAAKAVCYGDANFIVYLSTSATNAEMQTENLKKDLMGEKIKQCFGHIKAKSPNFDEVDESFSKKSFVARTAHGEHSTFILPRGSGQQIRGILWKSPEGKNCRPDLIIVDDLEDSENIENEDQRKKRKIWFFADVMKCFPRIEKNWSVIYIDTLKHEDALMQELLEAPDWDSMIASICDDQYKSRAPNFMDDKELMDEVISHRQKGIMDVFAREYMCMPISREDAAFKSEYFKYYQDNIDSLVVDTKTVDGQKKKEIVLARNIINIVLIDPSKTVKRQNAETGFIVWGVDLSANRFYLRHATGERLHPDEIFDRGIELCQQYGANVMGIETTGSKEFIFYPLCNEIVRRGLGIEPIELTARAGKGEFAGVGGGKKMRISSMIGWYRMGLVYHNVAGMIGAYETQLLSFPRGKRVDMIDAAAYIIEMMEKGGRFFYLKDMDNESYEDVEKEYEELEAEYIDEKERGLYDDDSWQVCP